MSMRGQEPQDLQSALAHLSEECAEVIQAVGKCQRWGLSSANPFLAKAYDQLHALRDTSILSDEGSVEILELVERMHPGETNKEWLKREMVDVEDAIRRLRSFL